MAIDTQKLARMQKAIASTQLGGKGTPRRKTKRIHTSTVADDRKLQATMKKLHAQTIPGIEVVNMFKEDGKVINIPAPTIQASVPCNTFCISGNAQEKELTDLIPDILHQLGPDSIGSLKRLAESFQQKGGASFDEAISEAKEKDEQDN